MKPTSEYELMVSPGKLPWWRIIVASLFFSAMIYFIYLLFRVFYVLDFTKIRPKGIAGIIEMIGLCLAGGISFSVTKAILIDLDKDALISIYMVGPFSRRICSTVPDLDYVSVFCDSKERYQVNLWYVRNKHYNMYCFQEKEPAMKFAELTAKKLNIDLLDATEKGNSKWIEIPKT